MRLVRAATAAVVLVVVIVGLPAALLHVGHWPITGLPTSEQWRDLPNTALTDTAVYGALTVAAWLVWALFTASAVAELAAEFTGRQPRSVPLAGPLQLGARQLVAAVLMAVAVTGPFARHAAAIPLPPRAAAPIAAATATRNSHPTETRAPPPTIASAPATITVAVGDNPWDLAEQHLGDGMRWHELYDLNRGAPQPDGRAWTVPDQIEAGWILQLPPSNQPNANVASGIVTVQPGDTLSEIAQDELGDANDYPELFAVNEGVAQPDGDTLRDPDLIRPGWILTVPGAAPALPVEPTPAPPAPDTPIAPASPAPISAPPTTVNGNNAAAPRAPIAGNGSAARDDPGGIFDAGRLGVAGAILSAGLAAVIRRRRRRQQQQRRPGRRLTPLPPTDGVTAELVAGDDTLARRVLATLQLLAADGAAGSNVSVPRLVHVHDEHVEVLLTEPTVAVADGWEGSGGGRIWTHPLIDESVLTDEGNETPLLPALTTIGALDDGGFLVNLEAEAVIGITGDPTSVADLAASMVHEQATNPLATTHSVYTVGLPAAHAALGVRGAADVAAALADVTAQTDAIEAAMTEADAATVLDLRAGSQHEPWGPVVVFITAAAIAADPESFDQLTRIARRRAGVAVVAVGVLPVDATEITTTADTLTVPALGLRCTPQHLDTTAVTGIAKLLDATDPAYPDQPAPDDETLLTTPERVDDGNSQDNPPTVFVLGAVRVEHPGGLTPQQAAMLSFLAVNGPATADALQHAVWAGRRPAKKRFANAIHELRRIVGTDHLPPSADGRYRLVGLASDLDLLEQRLATARTADAPSAALRSALELVTGPPLTYEGRHRQHYTWVDFGNHASRLEAIIGDAAHELSTTACESGDTSTAEWAARQGLFASPTNETLVGDLIAAHVAAGDRSTATKVLTEYEGALDDMGAGEPPAHFYELLDQSQAS
ncbi:MAG: hypothetical protein QOI95_2119 [Acidimicrobiaceae bacterium]